MPTAVRTTLLIACSFVVALLSVLNAHHDTAPAPVESSQAVVASSSSWAPEPVTAAPVPMAAPVTSSSAPAVHQHATKAPRKATARRCYEDESCWDNRTMGSRQAGPGADGGPVDGVCPAGGVYVPENEAGVSVCQY